jgi:leader peptidase (prepilin peptidase)/N-methyltransferase
MGLGDVKFAVLGGMIVGLKLSLIWLFLAFLTGAALGIILILGKKAGLKSKIAFGPFLIIAIPLALIFGDRILSLLNL